MHVRPKNWGEPLGVRLSPSRILNGGRAGATRLARLITAPSRFVLVALMLGIILFTGGVPTTQAQTAEKEIGGLTLSSDSPGTLQVSWETPTNAPTDYRVRWVKSNAGEQGKGNAYPDSSSYTITGLEEGVAYDVRVRARYAGEKTGPWSATVTIVVASEPERSTESTITFIDDDPKEPKEPKFASHITSDATRVADFIFTVESASGSVDNRRIHASSHNVRGWGRSFSPTFKSDGQTPNGRPRVSSFGDLDSGDAARINQSNYRDTVRVRSGTGPGYWRDIEFLIRQTDIYEVIYSDIDIYNGSEWGPAARVHTNGPVFAINMRQGGPQTNQRRTNLESGNTSFTDGSDTQPILEYMTLRVTFPDHPGERHDFVLHKGGGPCMTGLQRPRFTGTGVTQTYPHPNPDSYTDLLGNPTIPWHQVHKPGGWDRVGSSPSNHYDGVICWTDPGFAPGRFDAGERVRIQIFIHWPNHNRSK